MDREPTAASAGAVARETATSRETVTSHRRSPHRRPAWAAHLVRCNRRQKSGHWRRLKASCCLPAPFGCLSRHLSICGASRQRLSNALWGVRGREHDLSSALAFGGTGARCHPPRLLPCACRTRAPAAPRLSSRARPDHCPGSSRLPAHRDPMPANHSRARSVVVPFLRSALYSASRYRLSVALPISRSVAPTHF
jgi:hypothetical protein